MHRFKPVVLWRGEFLADSVCPSSIFQTVSSTSISSVDSQHHTTKTGSADHRSRPHVLRLRQPDRPGHATRSRHVVKVAATVPSISIHHSSCRGSGEMVASASSLIRQAMESWYSPSLRAGKSLYVHVCPALPMHDNSFVATFEYKVC